MRHLDRPDRFGHDLIGFQEKNFCGHTKFGSPLLNLLVLKISDSDLVIFLNFQISIF